MRFSLPLLVAVGLLTVTGCRHPQDGTVARSLEQGGMTRSYLVHLPPSHDHVKRWPLIVALHGHGGNGEQQERMTAMSTLADEEGFVVAYPDGIDKSWNDDRGESEASQSNVDDVGFINALIDKLVADESIDSKRVYVAGTSNGAMFSFRLACELSSKIAAFAPVMGQMPESAKDTCKPTHPMPMMMFLGTRDPLVPYEGGGVGFAGRRGRVLSADATREWWASFNGCTEMTAPETIDPADDDTVGKKTTHGKCKQDASVVVFAFENGGHTWPGGEQYLPKLVVGRVSHDVNATREMWSFFRAHQLP